MIYELLVGPNHERYSASFKKNGFFKLRVSQNTNKRHILSRSKFFFTQIYEILPSNSVFDDIYLILVQI